MKVVLRVEQCPMSGELGLVPQGMQMDNDFDDMTANTSGRMLAHDILEHVNGVHMIGTIEDELEALGACLYTRAQFQDLDRNSRYLSAWSALQSIGWDVANMMEKASYAGLPGKIPKTRAGDFEDDITEIVNFAVEKWDRPEDTEYDDQQDWSDFEEVFKNQARNFLRTGLRKQRKRFPKAGHANNLFWAIAEEVEGIKNSIENEGQRFELTYSIRNGEASIREIGEVYDY